MGSNKEFIQTFFPSGIDEISYVQIDLDITDLSVADILRNINKTFPINSKDRNSITNGNFVVGILCKSEKLDPMAGLLLLITNDTNNINIVSRNYIAISIPESKIQNEEDIKETLDNITHYLIKNFKDVIIEFANFYVKYIYDNYEYESEEYDSVI